MLHLNLKLNKPQTDRQIHKVVKCAGSEDRKLFFNSCHLLKQEKKKTGEYSAHKIVSRINDKKNVYRILRMALLQNKY